MWVVLRVHGILNFYFARAVANCMEGCATVIWYRDKVFTGALRFMSVQRYTHTSFAYNIRMLSFEQ